MALTVMGVWCRDGVTLGKRAAWWWICTVCRPVGTLLPSRCADASQLSWMPYLADSTDPVLILALHHKRHSQHWIMEKNIKSQEWHALYLTAGIYDKL